MFCSDESVSLSVCGSGKHYCRRDQHYSFFGPFIGAIPSAIIICFASPVKAVYFLILILALRQFDGNILGPKILGGTTGLASFWVLFAILVGGGLFGFIGMVLGVPVFAVFFYYLNRYLRKRLCEKNSRRRIQRTIRILINMISTGRMYCK